MNALIIVAIVILGLLILLKVNHLKHKIVAVLLVLFLLFFYISFTAVAKNNSVELNSFQGMTSAVKLYFSWLGNMFGNLKTLTGNVIGMNWLSNETASRDYMIG